MGKTWLKSMCGNWGTLLNRKFLVGVHLALAFGFALALLGLVVSPASLVAAQAPIDAEVEFFVQQEDNLTEDNLTEEEETPLTVGDQVKLRLEVIHPTDSQVVLPQLETQWGAFEVLDQTAPETIDNEDGTATTGKDISVTLFQPGSFQTLPLVVTHRKPDGSIEELAAPVIQVRVTSVLTEEVALRDLKPQAELPVPPLWPWVVGGLLLTMLLTGLLVGLGLIYYHRRQKRVLVPEMVAPVIDTRPPHVIAHAELDRIEALNLPAQNQVKEHYSLVDACLRRYIEGRYQIPALEQTSGEIRFAFKQAGVPTRAVNSFMAIFFESDLVKFARYVPPMEEVVHLIGRARAVVDTTTPRPLEAEPASQVPVKTEVKR